MSFGTAHRSTQHVMGFTNNPVYTPVWRVVAALVVAASVDGRLHHCYGGDTLDGLNDEQREHFLRLGLVEEIHEAPAAPASRSTSTLMRTRWTRPPRTATPSSNASARWRAYRCQPPRGHPRVARLCVATTSAIPTRSSPRPSSGVRDCPGQQLTLTVKSSRSWSLKRLPPPLGSSAAARPAADDHRRLRRRTRAWRGAGGNNLGGNDDEHRRRRGTARDGRHRGAGGAVRAERRPGTVPGGADVGSVAAG